MRVEHMLLRNRDLAIATAKELVDAYHMHCSEGATGVFQYNIVECFPAIQRIHKDSRKAIEIKGIRKIHTLRYSGDGIKATKTSCHECCKLDSECGECLRIAETVTHARIIQCIGNYLPNEEQEEDEEEEDDREMQGGGYEELGQEMEEEDDLEDIQQSDAEGDDDEDGEDWIYVGCPVWGLRYRRRLPAIICNFEDLPVDRQSVLRTRKPEMFYIQFVGIDKFTVVHKTKLIKMSNTPQDMMFAEGNEHYQMALAMGR